MVGKGEIVGFGRKWGFVVGEESEFLLHCSSESSTLRV